jgi:serine kinase of HPr protein (carbohydrate metabolism regulator)
MSATLHASCVLLGRSGEAFGAPAEAGILLNGPSGSGKSDLALRLIERGGTLVADDRIELFRDETTLAARAPRALAGLLEIRGVGIVELPSAASAHIALVVELVHPSQVARLPEPDRYAPPPCLGVAPEYWPPLMRMSASEPSAVARIAAAVAAHAHSRFRLSCAAE